MMYSFNCQLSIFNFQFSIFNFSDSQIFRFSDLGVPASRRAFRYIFARLIPLPIPAPVPAPALKSRPRIPSPSPNPEKLAKDAAPIPNAAGE